MAILVFSESSNDIQDISMEGLVLYLDASKTASYSGSGNIWNDLSPANNDGTLVTPTYNASGGGSFSFLPATDYVDCGGGIPALNLQQLTISFWVRPGTITSTNENYLFALDTPIGIGPYYGIGIDLGNFSSNAYSISTSAGDGVWRFGNNRRSADTTDRVVIKDVWQMMTFVYTSAQSVKIYRNGVEITNLTYSGTYFGTTIASSYGAGRTRIAHRWGGGGGGSGVPNSFNGFMNDVIVYSRALPQAEVVSIYNIKSSKYL